MPSKNQRRSWRTSSAPLLSVSVSFSRAIETTCFVSGQLTYCKRTCSRSLELFLQGARTDSLEPISSPITRRALVYRVERRSATPCAREARPAYRVEPNASGAEDHDRVA